MADKCPCKKHPRYLGKREPRVACRACWQFFFDQERIRGWVTFAKEQVADYRKRMGGKDRPTKDCTMPHSPDSCCYGCAPRD